MDGSAAAVAHQQAVGYLEGKPSEYQYLGINYPDQVDATKFKAYLNDKLGSLMVFDTMWFLDFCPCHDVLKYLHNNDTRVIIIDHHQTAVEEFAEWDYFNTSFVLSYDNKISGAGLTRLLTKLIPSLPTCHKVPSHLVDVKLNDNTIQLQTNIQLSLEDEYQLDPLYEFVRIRDVWDESDPLKKQMADQVYEYLTHNNCFNPVNFKALLEMDPDIDDMVQMGEVITKVKSKIAESAIALGHKCVIDGVETKGIQVLITVTPNKMDSMVGDVWVKRFPNEPALMIGLSHNHAMESTGAGLRSNELIDALKLAKALGGGGHLRACGCGLNHVFEDLPCTTSAINQYFEQLIREVY